MNRRSWLLWAVVGAVLTASLIAATIAWGGGAVEFASWVAGIASLVLAVAAFRSGTRDGQSPKTASPTLIVSALSKPRESPLLTEDSPLALDYQARSEPQLLSIWPRNAYLDLVRSGGTLEPLHYWHSPWSHSFVWPTLDVKVVNNSDATVLLHEVTLNVASSSVDLRPLPVIPGVTYGMSFALSNLGWGDMNGCLLRGNLRRAGPDGDLGDEFELSFNLPSGLYKTFSLEQEFAAAGVDVPLLKRLEPAVTNFENYLLPHDVGVGEPGEWWGQKGWILSAEQHRALRRVALGPFPDGEVELVGTIYYDQTELDGSISRRKNPLISRISLGGPPAGAALPPSHEYQLLLRSEGRDYQVTVPISHSLAAGESDRFLIAVAARRSSVHDFHLEVLYNQSSAVTSGPVRLELFVSTADAMFQNQ